MSNEDREHFDSSILCPSRLGLAGREDPKQPSDECYGRRDETIWLNCASVQGSRGSREFSLSEKRAHDMLVAVPMSRVLQGLSLADDQTHLPTAPHQTRLTIFCSRRLCLIASLPAACGARVFGEALMALCSLIMMR
jgi:hypothetical protein